MTPESFRHDEPESPQVPPADYVETDLVVYSTIDHAIDRALEARLRAEKVVMGFCAHNYHGEAWFDRDARLFHCAVYTHNCYRQTVSATTLDAVADRLCDEYGPE